MTRRSIQFGATLASALMLLWSCTPTSVDNDTSSNTDAPEVATGFNDTRAYRFETLSNGLKILMISAPGTVASAAALAVGVGTDHEPPNLKGLTHVTQEMLVLASRRYPDIDGYESFITNNGGTVGADFSNLTSIYYFGVNTANFPEALDRLAAFFDSPLYGEDYLPRELDELQREFELERNAADARKEAILRAAMNPSHPASRYSAGNLASLRGLRLSDVVAFYESHYSSDAMTLAVVDSRPLDEILDLVYRMFDPLQRRNAPPNPDYSDVFLIDQLPKALGFRTNDGSKSIDLYFQVPSSNESHTLQPGRFVAHLIANKDEGSLYDFLSTSGWLEDLSVSLRDLNHRQGLLNITLDLTDAGWNNLGDVRGYAFSFLDALGSAELESWRYEEFKQIDQVNFQFAEPLDAIDTAILASEATLKYSPYQIYLHQYASAEYDPVVVQRYLGHLSPSNSVTLLGAPTVRANRTETIFEVSYSTSPQFNQDSTVVRQFTLPTSNEFIPRRLNSSSRSPMANKPQLTIEEAGLNVWHAQDTSFRSPKAVVDATIHFQESIDDPRSKIYAQLMARMLQLQLESTAHRATKAGLENEMQVVDTGLRIRLFGYTEHLVRLFDSYVQGLAEFDLRPTTFERSLVSLRDQYADNNVRPFESAKNALLQVVLSNEWSPVNVNRVLDQVSLQDMNDWRQENVSTVGVTLLVVGDVGRSVVSELEVVLRENLSVGDVSAELPTARDIVGLEVLELDLQNDDTVYLSYLQSPSTTLLDQAATQLLGSLISPEYTTRLRMQEQIAVLVESNPIQFLNQAGLYFLAQSSTASIPIINDTTDDFLRAQKDRLANMSSEDFEAARASHLSHLQVEDAMLLARVDRYRENLTLGTTTFDFQDKLIAATSALTRADLEDLLDRLISETESKRLLIYSIGRTDLKLLGGARLREDEY